LRSLRYISYRRPGPRGGFSNKVRHAAAQLDSLEKSEIEFRFAVVLYLPKSSRAHFPSPTSCVLKPSLRGNNHSIAQKRSPPFIPRAAPSIRESIQAVGLFEVSALIAHDIAILESEGYWLEAASTLPDAANSGLRKIL
jgi:hypothetical protein